MYKIVRIHPDEAQSLEGRVWAQEERWDSIEDALDELSVSGWEISLPIYGSARVGDTSTIRLEGFVLVARLANPRTDLERRIAKLEELLEQHRESLADPMLRRSDFSPAQHAVEEAERHLAKLRQRLERLPSRPSPSARRGQLLAYGAYSGGRMSTEEDFGLAEWHPPSDGTRG